MLKPLLSQYDYLKEKTSGAGKYRSGKYRSGKQRRTAAPRMTKDTVDFFKTQPNLEKSRRIYTVSEISQDIKLILENAFGQVWVEGEISNFRAHTSGHFYFTLKDNLGILPAAMFNWANRDVKFKIENGLKVICFGKISIYGPHGQYQIIVEKIEPQGIGSLQLALEQLKKKLQKEGLFCAEHKRPIPYLPSKIGIVTSLSGAAIKDILKVLDRRFSDIHIIISPCQVQGETAKEEIAQAIKDLNLLNESFAFNQKIEVMIVGRGGGSIENLWAFNEEMVARAMYNSRIPIISAVGHERDWSIADLVADLRAATPSVAAELIIPKKQDLEERLDDLTQRLNKALRDHALDFQETTDDLIYRLNLAMQYRLELSTSHYSAASKKLILLNPVALIVQYKRRLTELTRHIYARITGFVKLQESEFKGIVEKLSSLSPLNILSRGYSITFKVPENEIIKDAELIKIGDSIKSRLCKGEVLSQVKEINKNN